MSDAAAQLERLKNAARERNRSYRARRRAGDGPPATGTPPASGPAFDLTDVSPLGVRIVSTPAPVHETAPLEDVGRGPEAYADVPPELAPGAVPEIPPSAEDAQGAKQVAAVVATLFRLALEDATPRYELDKLVGAFGVSDVAAAKDKATAFVAGSAERVAIKYGLGFTLPFQDELVTLGAAAGSLLYIRRRMRGELKPMPGEAPPAADAAGDDEEQEVREPSLTRVNPIDAESKEVELPEWMRGRP